MIATGEQVVVERLRVIVRCLQAAGSNETQ